MTPSSSYQYTTTVGQTKESSSTVDRGLHYVALDANGQPIDSDGDGWLPDYLEDGSGDGLVNGSEADWQSATDQGLKILIMRPRAGSNLP